MRLSAVAMTVTMVMACSKKQNDNGDYLNAVPENAMVLMYVDGYQMMQKTGLLEEFAAYRDIAANMAPNAVDDEYADFVQSIVRDFDNTGIATTAPVYAAVNALSENEFQVVAVAKVGDKGKLDKLVEIANDNGAEIETEQIDGCTIIFQEYGTCVGYNSSTLALVAGDGDCKQVVINTLKSAYTPRATELPDFKNYDLGMYYDIEKFVELAKATDRDLAEQCEMYADTDIFGDGMIGGLTFKPGHITLDFNMIGLSDAAKAKMETFYSHDVTNDYLKYLPVDTYAVLNGYFDGRAVWDMAMSMPAVKAQLEQLKQYQSEQAWQESMDMAKNILYSFDGDATMALNRIGDSYGEADVKASAMMTVTNDYIISLFGQYKNILGDSLTQVGATEYRVDLGDMAVNFGQQGSMLYASTEGIPSPVARSAADASWVKDIANAKYYLAVNLRKLFADPMVNTMMWREVYNDRHIGDAVRNLIGLLDYSYMRNSDDLTGAYIDIVMRNSHDNALKQIVDTILPVVMENIPINALLQ